MMRHAPLFVSLLVLASCGAGAQDQETEPKDVFGIDVAPDASPDSHQVGPEGGTLEFAESGNGAIRVHVPPGALTKSLTLQAVLVPSLVDRVIPLVLVADPEQEVTIAAVELGPNGTQFDRPISVEVALSAVAAPNMTRRVYLWDEGANAWSVAKMRDGTPIVGLVTPDGRSVAFQTDHFSSYAVGGLKTVFCPSLWSTDFPLAVPCSYFGQSAFADAGTIVLLVRSVRTKIYVQVLKELILRTDRPRNDAETSFVETVFQGLDEYMMPELDRLQAFRLLKYLNLTLNDLLVWSESQPDWMGSCDEDIRVLSRWAEVIHEGIQPVLIGIKVADCVMEGLLKLLALHAVDFNRAHERFEAAYAHFVESDLYKKDPAFQDAVAEVKLEIDSLQASVLDQGVEALEDLARTQCGLSAMKATLKFLVKPLLSSLGDLGAGLGAALIFKFAVLDVVMDDMVAGTQKGLALAGLGTIYAYGNLYSAKTSLEGHEIATDLWKSPDLQRELQAFQVLTYNKLAIHQASAEILRMEGASWMNRTLTDLVDWLAKINDATTREDIAKAHDLQKELLERTDEKIRNSYPSLCDETASPPALCGEVYPCITVCDFAECGDDGCGGSCGDCGDGHSCNDEGQCVPTACIGDCAQMVSVSAGSFWMGCNEATDLECQADEYPYHEVFLSAYLIDKTEVTVAAYRECVNAGVCTSPNVVNNSCVWGEVDQVWTESRAVNCVSWYQADKYCSWVGKRLPTEAEWEKAARGTDGRKFPWGPDEPTCEFAVIYGCNTHRPLDVCSTSPHGDSFYGLCDMSGNVMEWVSDWFDSGYYSISPTSNPSGPDSGTTKVRRGGSMDSRGGYYTRASYRNDGPPSDYKAFMGFRCAKDSPE